jgi:hypothetical protein
VPRQRRRGERRDRSIPWSRPRLVPLAARPSATRRRRAH